MDEETESVAEQMERIHTEYASAIQYNNENSLSGVVTLGYLSTMEYYYKPVRELPTGRGFADVVYLPKPEYRGMYPALIVELKWNNSVETAIGQIKEKNYTGGIKQYTGDILLVGIAYDKKSRQHTCKIEKVKKEM